MSPRQELFYEVAAYFSSVSRNVDGAGSCPSLTVTRRRRRLGLIEGRERRGQVQEVAAGRVLPHDGAVVRQHAQKAHGRSPGHPGPAQDEEGRAASRRPVPGGVSFPFSIFCVRNKDLFV